MPKLPSDHQAPSVYFVIVSWNNADIILECMESVVAQSYKNINIVLVDNNSSDDTVQLVRQKYPEIKIIENTRNDGFAIANNQGIKLALEDKDCGYIALLNSDARVDKNWTHVLIEFLEEHPHSSAAQTVTLDYYDHNVVDSRGIKVDPQGRAIQLGYRERRAKDYTAHKVFGVNAAACIYTAEFLRNQPFGADYFDSDLWMYLEDVDLAARSIMLGYNNWVVPGAFAYHMGSASSSKNPGFSVFYIYRNNLLMLLKNLPLKVIAKAIPGILITDIRTCIALFKSKNHNTLKALFKGRLFSLKMVPKFTRKRKTLLKIRRVTSDQLSALMNAD